MKNNGIIWAALIVMVIMGAVIAVQQGELIQSVNVEELPFCEYSTVINVQGLTNEGFYIGVDADKKVVCQQPLIKEGAVVDFGL